MRIRTIKPEFWRSQDVADLPRDVRLLWIGLWSYVDDNGVGIDDYRVVAADLFALDDPTEAREFVREGLATLTRCGRIVRYAVGDRSYLYVNGWEHQRIDRPTQSRFPGPSEADGASSRDMHEPSRGLHEPSNTANSGFHESSARGDDRPAAETTPEIGHSSPRTEPMLVPSENADPREDCTSPRAIFTSGTGEQGNRGTGENNPPCSPPLGDAITPKRAVAPDRFDEFWSSYPKRVGKQAAIKAWRKALKITDSDTIINGARRYAAARHGQDPQYTAHPSTWLNAGRWDDEPQPPPTAQLSTADQRIAQLQAMKNYLPSENPAAGQLQSLPGGRSA